MGNSGPAGQANCGCPCPAFPRGSTAQGEASTKHRPLHFRAGLIRRNPAEGFVLRVCLLKVSQKLATEFTYVVKEGARAEHPSLR